MKTTLCPECNTENPGSKLLCIACGASLAGVPLREDAPAPAQPEDASSPIERDLQPEPTPDRVFACAVCGRQDETLRAVVYPFVVSLFVVTFQRSFAGIWCRRHRNLRLGLASLLTTTIGWIGIPFGFLLTPLALFKLARGGNQPAELNSNMLRTLAEHKLEQGDAPGAARCLEASLRFRDDDEVQDRLREIHENWDLPAPPGGWQHTAQVLFYALFGAVTLGTLIGALDYAITAFLSLFTTGTTSFYIAALSWAPFLAMSFTGGLILFEIVEWALIQLRCRKLALAIGIASATAILAVYSMLQGSAIGYYVATLVAGGAFESVLGAVFSGILVVLAGGVLWLLSYMEPTNMSETIYLALCLVVTVYYLALGIRTAVRTTQWQRRLVI